MSLSNLIGRVAHKIGLKFGHSGLLMPIRHGDNMLEEILISDDFYECVDFLGFDAERHAEGFDSLQDIFEFVVKGKYFNKEIFLLDNRNAKARMRDSKRPTYTAFLAHCESIDEPGFQFSKNKDLYRGMIFSRFPDAKIEYERVIKDYEKRIAIKEKFNGQLVMELTGLEGKELGAFMKLFKETFDIENMSAEAIKSKLIEFSDMSWRARRHA